MTLPLPNLRAQRTRLDNKLQRLTRLHGAEAPGVAALRNKLARLDAVIAAWTPSTETTP